MTNLVDLLGNKALTGASIWLSRRRLRVIAYHGVGDGEAFRRQLKFFLARFNVVTGAGVLAAQESGKPLPERALWLTFDDGRQSVVETGLPELERVGLPATMFVCPGLIPDEAPYWWSVVESALLDGRTTLIHARVVPSVISHFSAGLDPPLELPSTDWRVGIIDLIGIELSDKPTAFSIGYGL